MRSLLYLGFAAVCHQAGLTAADITIIPGGVPKPFKGSDPAVNETDFFRRSVENEFQNNTAQVLLSSYSYDSKISISNPDGIRPSADSFVRGAIQAWGQHQHLVVRPEEVWFTILAQMNFFMIKNAESIRDIFVSHEGQEVIYIEDYTWYLVLQRFKDEIQARVKTAWLLDWIMPSFTTTTENDVMTANIMMMGLMQAYFKFEGGIICGLPSVTLLGEQKDWEALLKKLDRLADFGAEPKAYSDRLRPILSRFVTTFKEPDSAATIDFWNGIATASTSHTCGDPPYFISGWITGFYYWDANGNAYARDTKDSKLTLDGIAYPTVGINALPVAYARAPFIMHDFNDVDRFPAYVLAGSIGKKVTPGAPPGYVGALGRAGKTDLLATANSSDHSSLQPLSAWMLYGPVDHEATNNRWSYEYELYELTTGVRQYYNASQCVGHT